MSDHEYIVNGKGNWTQDERVPKTPEGFLRLFNDARSIGSAAWREGYAACLRDIDGFKQT